MATIHRTGQLIAGVIVAALGVLLLFERVIGLEFYGIWQLWPLVLVGIGVARMGGNTERKRSGLFLLLIGFWLLVNTLELFDLDWGTSWPLLLILLGIGKLIYPERDGRSGGILLILIGLWATVNVLELWGLYWDTSWPLAPELERFHPRRILRIVDNVEGRRTWQPFIGPAN